jgi:hypothetical protein
MAYDFARVGISHQREVMHTFIAFNVRNIAHISLVGAIQSKLSKPVWVLSKPVMAKRRFGVSLYRPNQ